MKNSRELLVECWYDKLDLESIKQWAYLFIEANDDIPEEVFGILDANELQVERLLLSVSTTVNSEFSPHSIDAELLAAKYLMKIGTKYLNGEVEPIDVCRVVGKIDSGFLGAPRGLAENIAYYPTWLGNLYHSCDWCDDSWTDSSAPHLKKDLEVQLIKISEWVESHKT